MSLLSEYYKNELLSMKRGQKNGKKSNAKPLFFLALVQSIQNGEIIGNNFGYEKNIENNYYNLCQSLEPTIKATLFFKPFYHSTADSFYHIKWKGGQIPDHNWHTPSPHFLRDNIDYAYLDPGLWDLLQDPKAREELKEAVINHFFSTK